MSEKTKKISLIVCLLFIVSNPACSVSDNQAVTLSETADNSTQTGDDGSFDPVGGGSTDVCETDADGTCVDTATTSDPVTLSTQSIDFGTSEEGHVECETLTIPGNGFYTAEIDLTNTASTNGTYEFALLTSDNSYSTERVEGSGTLSVCYLRTATGSHKGQLKLVIGVSGSSSISAYVISLNGETTPHFFTITSPTDGQIIDGREGHNEGVSNVEGEYYLITAAGSVNLDLVSILENGADSYIYIVSDNVQYRTTFDANGNFSKQIGVPQTPGTYTVTFSVVTNEEATLSKSVSVVVADKPKIEIEVRDSAGNEIDTSAPTDALELVVGFKISNLDVSGASASDMPVTLSGMKFNDTELSADTQIWLEEDTSWCFDSGNDNKDYAGFNTEITYCTPLSRLTDLPRGLNTVSATAKNDLGESTQTITLIIDNDKPSVVITEPSQNEVMDPDLTSITISGTIKKFAPLSQTDWVAVPDAKSDDTGSYCQPQSASDTSCPASSLKLWFNISPDDNNMPIYIYPDFGGYDADNIASINETVYNNNATRGYCVEGDDGLSCNIPEGKFSITLPFDSSTHAALNLFANILHFRAESLSGHRAIKMVTFKTGEIVPHHYQNSPNSKTVTLTAGDLGTPEEDCGVSEDTCVSRAPVMLFVSEGFVNRETEQGKRVIKVIENYLNENLRFADMANGWPHPENEDGEVDLLADLRDQYKDETGDTFTWVTELDEDWQKRTIWQGLHSTSMAQKDLALLNYRAYQMLVTEECEAYHNEMCFLETTGDPFDFDTGFATARDACGNEITTAFVPLSDLQHVANAYSGVTSTIPFEGEWPVIAGMDLDFNDFTEGVWHVDSINLKSNGYVDANICLVPGDIEVEDCDDNVSHAKTPAFWGHFAGYNLIKGGLLQTPGIDDETMPLIWSLGKVRLKLNDIIALKNKTLDDGTWTNYLEINLSPTEPEAVDVDIMDMEHNAEVNSIILEPFGNCDGYYKDLYKSWRTKHATAGVDIPAYSKSEHLPHGCNPDYKNGMANYALLLDRTSSKGKEVYNLLLDEGEDNFLLANVWQGVVDTFKKQIGCMDEELIAPMLNPDAFDYPGWVTDSVQVPTEFEWEDFVFGLNLGQADLNISEGGLTARLPLSASINGVSRQRLSSASKTTGMSFLGRAADAIGFRIFDSSGHLVRSTSNKGLEKYPLQAEDPVRDAFLSTSINVEELFNAFTHLLFRKGPFSLLETFEVTELEVYDNWTIGIDKVVLGRLDICNIAGLLPTDLPVGQLFPSVQSLFDSEILHFDVILDPDYPPTLSFNPIEGANDAVAIQLGLTNLQIGVKELFPADVENQTSVYENPEDQKEVLRVRMDAVISLKAIYHDDLRMLNIFVEGYQSQNMHLSVPSGHGGGSYDDVNVVTDLVVTVVAPLFQNLNKNFSADSSTTPTISISLADEDGSNRITLSSLVDATVTVNMSASENQPCNGDVPYYADEVAPSSETGGKREGIIGPQIKIMDVVPQIDICDIKNRLHDNPIQETLCNFGISQVTLDPTISFDYNNGYLHLSSDVEIELEEWLEE